MENSKIEWTEHTFNPWIGCTHVSPGCDHCYAEELAKRYKMADWGAGAARKLTGEENWKKPLRWNRACEKAGRRDRVFCASLADVFDNEVPEAWRHRLYDLIQQTPHLDWLLLTKRIGNAADMLPQGWRVPENVWLGASIVNQQEADRDIIKLLQTPAAKRFLSMEPLLGPVDLRHLKSYRDHSWQYEVDALSGRWCKSGKDAVGDDLYISCALSQYLPAIDWVIVGGESGDRARPMQPTWARSLRDQCSEARVPFMFKQWGEWHPTFESTTTGDVQFVKTGKTVAGRELDGRTWDGVPL